MKFKIVSVLSPSFLLIVAAAPFGVAFNNPIFQKDSVHQQTVPAKQDSVPVELPNFDALFGRIERVSPLFRMALEAQERNQRGTFDSAEDKESKSHLDLKWKPVETNQRRLVSQVEKIDNFQGLNAPLLRFRSSMQGPCHGDAFANFMMNLDDRKKWDAQIHDVYEAYSIDDLDPVNNAMGFNYGDCTRLGVGHCITKPNLGIDAREQLTLCGINEFSDGSWVIWGTEMEDWHNHLFPPGRRVTRSKSHLFSTTLTPTGPDSFDVEYVLQLDIGGKLPNWMTTPILVENVKKLFACAQDFYLNKNGELETFLVEKEKNMASIIKPSEVSSSDAGLVLEDDTFVSENRDFKVPVRNKHTLYL